MSDWNTEKIAHRLKQGAVIAYPTETLWGLGCLPYLQNSLLRILEIKQRSLHKGMILISSDIKWCFPYIDEKYHSLALQKITINPHQPTTWLAPKSEKVFPEISGNHITVGIRISPHPFIKKISPLIQSPLISTSANLSNHKSLNSAKLIEKQFGQEVDYIVKGEEDGLGHFSRIIDLVSGSILR